MDVPNCNGIRGPSTTIYPASPGPGNQAQHGTTVSEIKAKAKEAVQKEGRGVSAMTLIKTARSQVHGAKEYEAKGELKHALASFIRTASLMKMAMDSPEFTQEAVRSEWNSLVGVCYSPILLKYEFTRDPRETARI